MKKSLTRRQSQRPDLSRFVQSHESRQLVSWLIFDVRQKSAVIDILFPEKIGRLGYAARLIVFVVLIAPVSLEIAKVDDEAYVPSLSVLLGAFAALGYWFFGIVRPRCKDCGWSPWLAIATFVPALNLCLWIALLFPASVDATQRTTA